LVPDVAYLIYVDVSRPIMQQVTEPPFVERI
jgi:hypothetical protein